MSQRRRWLVEGRVQGVAFRHSTREAARGVGGLTGYVRNLDDGRVEVVAEGDPKRLEALESYLRHGPSAAQVRSLTRAPVDPYGDLGPDFEIRF